MDFVSDLLFGVGHVAAVLGVIAVIIGFGRFAADRLGQPKVVGEITVGLLAGPVALWLLGPARFAAVLPGGLLAGLQLLTHAALALFLVGTIHKLRLRPAGGSAGAIGWTVAGSVVPAATGVLLAGYVLFAGPPSVRGSASAASLVVMLALSLSVTAVPVLARILADRRMTETPSGRVAFGAAVVVDSTCWLLLPVAAGLAGGQPAEVVRSLVVLAGAALTALVVRGLLRKPAVDRWCATRPGRTRALVGVLAVGMALAVEQLGLTVIFGAVLAGMAVPAGAGGHWEDAVEKVSTLGRALVPIFFVVTGITVFTKDFGAVPVLLIGIAVVLGAAGKLLGSYLGARLGGQSRWDSLRIGALMNTRGLTELIVLQFGYGLGILTAPLFLALVVMALVTTALTGPLLGLIDRAELRRRPEAEVMTAATAPGKS
ncbi:cation:proton antiporter [Amycolatopsis sp. NPDC004747]